MWIILIIIIILICINYVNDNKYNKNDNMTKELLNKYKMIKARKK